jgi:hypothetical protein
VVLCILCLNLASVTLLLLCLAGGFLWEQLQAFGDAVTAQRLEISQFMVTFPD